MLPNGGECILSLWFEEEIQKICEAFFAVGEEQDSKRLCLLGCCRMEANAFCHCGLKEEIQKICEAFFAVGGRRRLKRLCLLGCCRMEANAFCHCGLKEEIQKTQKIVPVGCCRMEANAFCHCGLKKRYKRFKQLQQEKENEKVKSASSKEFKTASSIFGASIPKAVISKPSLEFEVNVSRKTATVASGGKLAFSLKQKSKIAAPSVKLGGDEDEKYAGNSSGDGPVKQQRMEEPRALHQPLRQIDVGSYLMKAALITITMNINLVKRKRLYRRPAKPKHHIDHLTCLTLIKKKKVERMLSR